MKNIFNSILVLSLFLSACTEEANELTVGTENTSVLIFNEGNFNSSDATIDLYDTSDSTYYPSVFKKENGFFIGDVLQSVTKSDDKFYVVLNGSSRVEVVSATDFSSLETLSDNSIDKPRYIAVDGETAYLSVWGPYDANYNLTDSKVVKIDLGNMEVVEVINTEPGVEQLLKVEGKLLVGRNYFGNYNHITIIDIEQSEVEVDMELPEGPEEIFLDSNGNAWVICSSGYLAKIDVINHSYTSINLEGEVLGDIEIINDQVYYYQAGAVKRVDLNTENIETLITGIEVSLPHCLGVDPNTEEVFIGDAIDYGVQGKVLHYNNKGESIDDFTVGIFPTQFIFD